VCQTQSLHQQDFIKEERRPDRAMELRQIIYKLLAAQIKFGTHRHKDPLPKTEKSANGFLFLWA